MCIRDRYNSGTAWNGLSTVTESPSGAEPTAIYADNIKYLNLMSAEEFGGDVYKRQFLKETMSILMYPFGGINLIP